MATIDIEQEMIQAARQGKGRGYDWLMNRYADCLMKMICEAVDNTLDAEELVQDAFVKAFSQIGSYDPQKAQLGTWLRRIAWNGALNHLKRYRPLLLSIDEEDDNLLALSDEDEPPPEDAIELNRAIDLLQPQERMLVQFYYYDELPLQEIAFIMDSKPTALANRLTRIRKKLYKQLKDKIK